MADFSRAAETGQGRWPVRRILLLVSVILAELCLIPSIFVPFLSTRFGGREVTASLLTTPSHAFASVGDEAPEAWSVALGIAFIVLLLVMAASIIAVPLLLRRGVTRRLSRFITVVVVLLVAGALGTWVVVGILSATSEPRTLGPGLPLLTAGALIAAIVTFTPSIRRSWAR